MDGLDPADRAVLLGDRPVVDVHDSVRTAPPVPGTSRFSADCHDRGDRLFIGLLASAYLHLLVVGVSDWPLWVASLLSLAWLVVVLRWG